MTENQRALNVTALRWGVKESFCRYVAGMGGAIDTLGGAARAEDGAFVFAAAPDGNFKLDESGKPQGRVSFKGEVRFKAHGGALAVNLIDPTVETDAKGASLTVADGQGRVELARLDLAAMTRGDAGEIVIPSKLSFDGSYILGDHYPPTTPLDPVRLILASR